MNSIAVMVASDVPSDPGKRAFIRRMDASMCFFCRATGCSPRMADVQRRAWKMAASVRMRGVQGEGAGVEEGSMVEASGG